MRREGYKREIVDYFKKNLKKGYTEDSLRWSLVKQGYSRVAVENAIKQTNKELSEEAPILEKPVITREVFDESKISIKTKKSWWKRIFGIQIILKTVLFI